MEVVLLKRDGRCRWLENKVLNGVLPDAIKAAANPYAKRRFIIMDWISNDKGRVGVDLKWFRSMGVPAVASHTDLPAGSDVQVINTGYDAIVDEEARLRQAGVEIVDAPCPFIRSLRRVLEGADAAFQYVLLCDPNHIVVKNFASIFPPGLILAQPENYRDKIGEAQNGKPFKIVPYVTFAQGIGEAALAHVKQAFPGRASELVKTSCLWVQSKASPLIEIDGLTPREMAGIDTALLIGTPGSTNRSLVSMWDALRAKGLAVVPIGSLREYLAYARSHRDSRVLLVRTPIPNLAEAPILACVEHGLARALWVSLCQRPAIRHGSVLVRMALLRLKNRVFRRQAIEEAQRMGALRAEHRVTWVRRQR